MRVSIRSGSGGNPRFYAPKREPKGVGVSIRSGSGGNPRFGMGPLTAVAIEFQSARVPGGTRDDSHPQPHDDHGVSIRSGSGGNPR